MNLVTSSENLRMDLGNIAVLGRAYYSHPTPNIRLPSLNTRHSSTMPFL
jgi:hypothetical protein